MDYVTFFFVLCILTFLYVITINSSRRKSCNTARLPPGSYPLPVIGNIFELGKEPHNSLASLSKTYGPLMSLKLGSIITIVVSSPKIAKEILLHHDLSFSSRSIPDAGRMINHHLFSMVWLPVGDKWRRLRRISKEHLFSLQQLDAGKLPRSEKIKKLLDHVHECSINNKPINIGRAAFTTSLNVLSNFIFSTDMARYESFESQEFEDAICALADIVGKPNLADFFPLLKQFDPQGLIRKGNVYAVKLMNILGSIVDERVQVRAKSSVGLSSTSHDVLDLLLDLNLKNESELSRNDILHMLLVISMFFLSLP
ncbi:cytochrome P450 [Artemisia annua]|uniref:Cytochrome P450 n=1 Tax=Artemisia annua TaxID=35608 RepID=A0A2U1MPN2_ARTAN|nr:cytochrome P450 [Artemisia annua]